MILENYLFNIDPNNIKASSESESVSGQAMVMSRVNYLYCADTYDKTSFRKLLIGRNPEICGGDPIIIGTRISVVNIIEKSKILGWSIEEIQMEYPHLSSDQIIASLEYYASNKSEIDILLLDDQQADDASAPPKAVS
jgi:uncharacterized protein (DUF433 family)